MRSLKMLLIYVLVAGSSVTACGPLYPQKPPVNESGAANGLDHEYSFTPADFGIPDARGQFSRSNPLGKVAGYEFEALLSNSTRGRAGYIILLTTRESKDAQDGQFEVTATAACEGGSSTEVTMIHTVSSEQQNVIAHCSGSPKGFSIQSIRFIPDLP